MAISKYSTNSDMFRIEYNELHCPNYFMTSEEMST